MTRDHALGAVVLLLGSVALAAGLHLLDVLPLTLEAFVGVVLIVIGWRIVR